MSTDTSFLSKKVVSSDGPNADEEKHDSSLAEWCATRMEPAEEAKRRINVLTRINSVVKSWIQKTMVTEYRMTESTAREYEGRIFTTGSYRYNVHTSGSDIDMVLIAPNRITRDHFFDVLAPLLKREPWVNELHCIRESRVPLIAMVCEGVDIDLSFGTIRQDCVPEVITDDLLQGLDEQSILSCNAVRVAQLIMDLVPNKNTFRQTLRFVKAWGKYRLVYSNTFGFPSGIGWAILVAYVCQLYPNQSPAGMVTKFFRTYSSWFKPTGQDNRAIYLTESMRKKGNLGRSWDPRESKSDAMALFPVLTPALPYGNACYNVTLTNLKQLCDEFRRGNEIINRHLKSMSESEAKEKFGPYGIWSKLLENVEFIGHYDNYLHIQISCCDADHYQAYVDGVESKIRILWAGNASSRGQTLEDIKQLRIHLNPRRYEDPAETEVRLALMAKKNPTSGSTRTSTQIESPVRLSTSSGKEGTSSHVTWFTAHYILGMTVDRNISTEKIDLVPAIRTFNTVVRQLNQYKEGITRFPVIRTCNTKNIPQFIKDIEGFKDEINSTSTMEGGEMNQADSSALAHEVGGKENINSTVSSKSGEKGTPSVDASASKGVSTGKEDTETDGSVSVSRKRERGDDAVLDEKVLERKDDTEDDLEQALGLGF